VIRHQCCGYRSKRGLRIVLASATGGNMTTRIDQYAEPGRFESHHWMAYRHHDGRYEIHLSGIAIIHFQGNSTSDWRRETFLLRLRTAEAVDLLHLPPEPPGRINVLNLDQWLVYAGLNAVYDAGAAVESGFAVDRFYLGEGRNMLPSAEIGVDLAARDVDATLLRVGYQFRGVAPLTTIPTP
jgi:hypothetical protein